MGFWGWNWRLMWRTSEAQRQRTEAETGRVVENEHVGLFGCNLQTDQPVGVWMDFAIFSFDQPLLGRRFLLAKEFLVTWLQQFSREMVALMGLINLWDWEINWEVLTKLNREHDLGKLCNEVGSWMIYHICHGIALPNGWYMIVPNICVVIFTLNCYEVPVCE